MIWMLLMAVAVPLATLLVMLKGFGWKVRRDEDKERLGAFLGSSVGISLIAALIMYYGGTSHTRFSEVWNYKGVEVRHYERWDEYIHKTCTRDAGKDSNGNTITETYDCSYVENHPEIWVIVDEYGGQKFVDEAEFLKWSRIFTKGKTQFVDMHRYYHSRDGDMYSSKWQGEFDRSLPLADIHIYTNRVRASHSIFKFPEPTPQLLAKYPRPADVGDTDPIQTFGPEVKFEDQMLVKRINAKYGKDKQIHILVMLFVNEDRGVIYDVLSSWQGVNKNELVTFISVNDDGKAQWCETHSWMDDTTIHAQMQNDIMALAKWDAQAFAKVLEKAIPLWRRKEFADFSYIKIPISWGWFVSQFMLSLVACIGAAVTIQFHWEEGRGFRRR